jgi:large subunit ribosomal protein L21
VVGEIVEQGRDKKVVIFKKRRRQNSRRKRGHRQPFTLVRITEILTEGRKSTTARRKSSKPAKEPEAEAVRAEAEAPAKTEAPAAEALAPSAERDDLKKLTGVGPALEKKLNAAGVTRFEQIANWTEEDIDRLDAELNIKGRVERDDWVGQAKTLSDQAKEK